MISTEGLKTIVEFGKDGKGTIVLTAMNCHVPDKGLLVLQMFKPGCKEYAIGDKPEPEDREELPQIQLHFRDTKSIDALIECLQKTKFFMQYPYGVIPYAC